MPPRFTYWTIILDGQPTAFRSAEREQLLPTLKQLQTKNPGAVLKWFAHGRVWESPDEVRQLRERKRAEAREATPIERRGRGWRPGGEHKDPREKFKRETFQARKRRDKKAANLAGGPRDAGVARVFPPSPKRFGETSPPSPKGFGRTSKPAFPPAPPAEPGRVAPSHKTRVPSLRKPR
jgi:hypothetical protein